jgi:ATP-dependent RNA helicase DOB1
LPLLDAFEDMNVHKFYEPEFAKRISDRIKSLEQRLSESVLMELSSTDRKHLVENQRKCEKFEKRIEILKEKSDLSQMTQFRTELKNRMRVLRRLGHIDVDGVVQLKVCSI